jgi:hypothetical protein
MGKKALDRSQWLQSYSTKCHQISPNFGPQPTLFSTIFSHMFGLTVNGDQKCAFVRLQLCYLRLTAHLFPVVACPKVQYSLRGGTKHGQKHDISQKLFWFATSTSE